MDRAATLSESISQERSLNYIRQVKGSFLLKGAAALASFLTLPLMIRYLGQEKFGVWSTLFSIVSWIAFFDLGIGSGLRNKVAESLSKDRPAEANHYLSTAYSLIGFIAIGLCVIIGTIAFFIPWQSVFNTRTISEPGLIELVLLTTLLVSANFWVGLVNQVLNAVQKSAMVAFGQFLSNVLVLLALYILVVSAKDSSLLLIATVYGFSFVISNVLLSAWFYKKMPNLTPSLSLYNECVTPLMTLSIRFLVIQCAVLVIFTTDKIIITQLLGPQYVTQYDVVFKLFGLLMMVHGIISAPLWSAYTEAFHQNDIGWIQRTLRQQLFLFGVICIGVIAMALFALPIISIWIGGDVDVPVMLVLSAAAFAIVSIWNNVFAYLVNGTGKIRLQMRTAAVGMVANIPLSFFMVKVMGMEVDGVVWATVISLLPFAFLAPFQVRKLLEERLHETA